MANEKRIRVGSKSGTLGTGLSDSDTTIDFGSDPGFATLAADEHIALILDPAGTGGAPEIVYLTAYTATNTTGTIVRAREGTTNRSHSGGVAWKHGPTLRDFGAGRVGFTERTSGHVTLNSTSWADVDTNLDIPLGAQAGDVVEVGLNAMIENQNVVTRFDVICTASGASFGSSDAGGSAAGIMGWFAINSAYVGLTGSFMRVLTASDVSGGVVTLRLRYQTASGTNRTLYASADFPLQFWAKNHTAQLT